MRLTRVARLPSEPETPRAVIHVPNDPPTIPVVLRAAELLHAYGTPAHRLERVVVQIAEHFGHQVQVFNSPTSIFVGFGGEVRDRVRLLRVEPGGVDLGKLVDIDELLEEVEAGRVGAEETLLRLEELSQKPPRWGKLGSVVGHAFAAGTAALFFGGRFADIALSFVLGALIGLIEIVSTRRESTTGVFEPLAAFMSAGGGLLGAYLWPGLVDDRVVALASIIVLVPGLSLTVALVELATRHLASGTARLMGAASAFLTIGFGAFLGRLVVGGALGEIGPVEVGAPEGIVTSYGAIGLALVLAGVGFGMLFRARLREFPWIVGAGAVGFVAARGAAWLYGRSGATEVELATQTPAVAAFTGAVAVGVFANAYARWADRPATVPRLPGLLVLVPGSVGYKALSAFTDQNALTGLETAFQMLLVAAALVGGLLTSNVVLPPRRVL